ncbi:Imm7 family immunity protein [Streptomyces sp. NPDC057249]|uniref:Imm7 family immunity protein n=1 Tax=Streptomyces sp. NPDC057249 TaxID=3346067 RepID=UPI00362AE1D5
MPEPLTPESRNNGELFVAADGLMNRRRDESEELDTLLHHVCVRSPGSWGLLYARSPVMARGRLHVRLEPFLSPVQPVIEDWHRFDADGAFSSAWLADGPKSLVPVPAGSCLDAALVRRVTEGCRMGGADAVLVQAGGSGTASTAWRPVAPGAAASELVGVCPLVVLAASDRQGAVLFSRPGYALVAGTAGFLEGAVPEGVDGGRARFGRYARVVGKWWPEVMGIARSFSARHISWARARDVPAGTGVARQVHLMRGLTTGSIGGADFARGWPAARRTSQNDGERLRDPLRTALDAVFSLLEDYSIDPDLKSPGDLSDRELTDAVREIVERTEGF